jgi:hypothetical protein
MAKKTKDDLDSVIKKYKKSKEKLEYLKINYKYKNLGFVKGGKVLGFAYIGEDRIELDKSLEGKELLEIFVHEAGHNIFPRKAESEIDFMGKTIADLLWRAGYRKVKK